MTQKQCEIAKILDGVNRQMWADHVKTCKKCNKKQTDKPDVHEALPKIDNQTIKLRKYR